MAVAPPPPQNSFLSDIKNAASSLNHLNQEFMHTANWTVSNISKEVNDALDKMRIYMAPSSTEEKSESSGWDETSEKSKKSDSDEESDHHT